MAHCVVTCVYYYSYMYLASTHRQSKTAQAGHPWTVPAQWLPSSVHLLSVAIVQGSRKAQFTQLAKKS